MFTISNGVEIWNIILSSYIVLEGLSYKYVTQIKKSITDISNFVSVFVDSY